MSNPESFIDEVNEELQRDRLFAALRKYGWIGIAAVILIVGGAGVNEWRKAAATARAQAFGDAVFTALQAETADARLNALSTIDTPAEGAPLAALMTASQTEDPADTVALLDSLAADAQTPVLYRQLARLRAVMAGASVLDPADRQARLESLIAENGPFTILAKEQLALVLIENGDNQAAIAELESILRSAEASQRLLQRASQMMVAAGGDPEKALN